MLPAIFNHLWQSTAFAGIAWLLVLVLRKNRARVRHGIWLAASLKFLIPISLLITLGSEIQWRPVPITTPSSVSIAIDEVSQPFTTSTLPREAAQTRNPLPAILSAIWLCGFLGIAFAWYIRWRRIRKTVNTGSPIQLELPIRAVSSPTMIEPGVFGIFRPILLLPEGIADRLTPTQLKAVIAHELCHVRHRDNLIAAIHMSIETVFWFHPLVWWIGKRMIEEREYACDDEVVEALREPRAYAEGILNICKLYTESPLVCVSGITGADLRKRIEAIMTNRAARNLTLSRKLTLAAAALTAVTLPISVGLLTVHRTQAQSLQSAQKFEVASIKPNISGAEGSRFTPAPGRIDGENVPVDLLIRAAFSIQSFQIVGAPDWINSARFDILAKAEGTPTDDQMLLMLQSLLGDRFQLKFHRETRELPIYSLTVAKSGFKLHESTCTIRDPMVPETSPAPGQPNYCEGMRAATKGTLSVMDGQGIGIATLPRWLSQMLGRPVVDKTGLNGRYDLHLEFSHEQLRGEPAAETIGPSIFTAFEDQLGLKLSTDRGSAEVLVIDHIEKPTEN